MALGIFSDITENALEPQLHTVFSHAAALLRALQTNLSKIGGVPL